MFEVKYPNTHGLDGKVHKIEVIEAYEVMEDKDKTILVYGLDSGVNTMITLKFDSELKSFVFVPYTKMEMINLTSEYLERKDITNKFISEINGKRILSSDEIKKEISQNNNEYLKTNEIERNKYFPKVSVKEDLFVDDSKAIINNFINNSNDLEDDNEKKNSHSTVYFAKDIMDVFSRHKKEVLNVIYKFLSKNEGKYENNKYELEILKLVNELMNTIVKVKSVIFTEDDLIDIGSLLAKLSFERVKNLSQNEFDNIINNGYMINDNLKDRIKKTK